MYRFTQVKNMLFFPFALEVEAAISVVLLVSSVNASILFMGHIDIMDWIHSHTAESCTSRDF